MAQHPALLQSSKLEQRRIKERQRIKEANQQVQKEQFRAMVHAYRDRQQRSEEKMKNNAFRDDQVIAWKMGEEKRERWMPERRARALSESAFKKSVSNIVQERIAIEDEFADLRAEKRALLEQARVQRVQMQVERSRIRHQRAAELRPNNEDSIRLRREQKEAEKIEKMEFFRTLTGWDGQKLGRRTRSVTALWNEHKEARKKQQALSLASSSAVSMGDTTEQGSQTPSSSSEEWSFVPPTAFGL